MFKRIRNNFANMKKFCLLILFAVSLWDFSSCTSNEKKLGDAADEVTTLMESLQKGDSATVKKVYPATSDFPNGCYKPNTYTIDSIAYSDAGKATAYVSFNYTNKKKIDFDRHLTIYLKQVGTEGSYSIVESKGLGAFTESEIFRFASLVGGVQDVKDAEMSDNLAICTAIRNDLITKKKDAIDSGWRQQGKYQWWNGTKRINFSGIVTNNSGIKIPKVKLVFSVVCDGTDAVRLEKNLGDVEPSTDYDYMFETFVLENIRYASWWNTSFKYEYDDSFIKEIVDNAQYSQNEFEQFKKNHKDVISAIIKGNSTKAKIVNYVGKVGSDAVTMQLSFKSGTVSGTYYYDKKGSSKKLTLKGTVAQSGYITMDEYDESGQTTGSFILNSEMVGSFLSESGNSCNVKLKEK